MNKINIKKIKEEQVFTAVIDNEEVKIVLKLSNIKNDNNLYIDYLFVKAEEKQLCYFYLGKGICVPKYHLMMGLDLQFGMDSEAYFDLQYHTFVKLTNVSKEIEEQLFNLIEPYILKDERDQFVKLLQKEIEVLTSDDKNILNNLLLKKVKEYDSNIEDIIKFRRIYRYNNCDKYFIEQYDPLHFLLVFKKIKDEVKNLARVNFVYNLNDQNITEERLGDNWSKTEVKDFDCKFFSIKVPQNNKYNITLKNKIIEEKASFKYLDVDFLINNKKANLQYIGHRHIDCSYSAYKSGVLHIKMQSTNNKNSEYFFGYLGEDLFLSLTKNSTTLVRGSSHFELVRGEDFKGLKNILEYFEIQFPKYEGTLINNFLTVQQYIKNYHDINCETEEEILAYLERHKKLGVK